MIELFIYIPIAVSSSLILISTILCYGEITGYIMFCSAVILVFVVTIFVADFMVR